MTIQRTIDLARAHLNHGNAYAYAAVMSGGIRGAMSKRSIHRFRVAIESDGMAHAFDHWDTSVPTAKRGFI